MARTLYNTHELEMMCDRAHKRSLDLYQEAPGAHAAGRSWYFEANWAAKRLARAFDIPVDMAAAAFAVLSPQIMWQDAMLDAWKIGWGDTEGYMALPISIEKAYAVVHQGDQSVIKGKKVRAFWDNIERPATSRRVTLDTHMARIYGIPAEHVFERKGVYEALEAGVQKAAFDLDLMPHQLQASLWIAYKTVGQALGMGAAEPTGEEF